MKKYSALTLIFTLALLMVVDTSFSFGDKKKGNRSGNRKSSINRSNSNKQSSSGNKSSRSHKSNKNHSNKHHSDKHHSNKNKLNKSSTGNNKFNHSDNSKRSDKNSNSKFSNKKNKNQNKHHNDHQFKKNSFYKHKYSNKSWNHNKHYDKHHDHWHHGHWDDHHHHPVAKGIGVWGAWNLGSRIYSSGYYSYSNPYYVESSSVQEVPAVNYSVPMDSSSEANNPATGNSDEGMNEFNAGITEFKNGNYPEALNITNSVLKSLPNDMAIHEFRALTLFAMKNYTESASAVYSLLSVGPGWDWKTMRSLYPNAETYTGQLRKLESYCREHKEDSASHFLLAYHYITCGHTDHAVKELKIVSQLNPDDQLASRLIGSFENDQPADSDKPPAPQETAGSSLGNAASSQPVTKEALAGIWVADQGEQGKITLTLNPDGNYVWDYKSKNVSDSLKGTYIVGGNILTLVDSGGRPMVGNVIQPSPDQFNFKLTGNGSDDPGLNFKK